MAENKTLEHLPEVRAAVVFGAQARCVLAGRNWNMWRHQKNNKNKARRNKK